jgi:general secretion pathway protein A
MTAGSYEAFFGLVERPFSLTPDPKFFYKSRSHGRALESLTFGLRRRDSFLLLTGDLGLGKTTTCRTLVEQLKRRVPVAYAGSPLLSSTDLLRLLLQDFGAVSPDDPRIAPGETSPQELYDLFVGFISGLHRAREGAVLVIDEAHDMPASLVDQLLRLTSLTADGQKVVQVVMAAHPGDSEPGSLGIQPLDSQISTRARLLPFGREDCAEYVAHRLTIAGGAGVTFSSRAIDVLFGLSGGVPRLVNLLCERGLQESAALGSQKIELAAIEAAASALELLRTRPKRFRWFHKRVS